MSFDAKVTIRVLSDKAARGEKIAMLALYDFPLAVLAEQVGLDGVVVGDSLTMSVYGHENTLRADMELMIRHTAAVRRGAPNVFLVADMPYMSYQPSVELAVRNAGRFMAEAGADAVKFEGGTTIIDKLEAVLRAGIPVVGHLGFLPQSAAKSGGIRVETREAHKAVELVKQAVALDQAGVSLLILECVPDNVAAEIIARVNVPVIGIGSGPACHGQVLLAYDILGLYPRAMPRFVEKYAELAGDVAKAFGAYIEQTRSGEYPAVNHCYHMTGEQQKAFAELVAKMDKPCKR